MSLQQSPLLAVFNRRKPIRTPVWFMRQAGRYLPEYRAIRKEMSMIDAIRSAETAAEITLQPLRRFDLDGAVIFADILNPLIGMGVELDFIEKEGPKIFNPISDASGVNRLTSTDPKKSVAYTLDAIRMVEQELTPRGVPVLGFCGAPFTLSTYLIEGRTSHSLSHLKQFIANHRSAWHSLQDKLVTFLVDYLEAQVQAGASAVQIFDSWAGYLSPYQFEDLTLPHLMRLCTELKKRISAPIIYFSTGTTGLFEQIRTLPVDGVSIDWRVRLSAAAQIFGEEKALQGNLDPEILACSKDFLAAELDNVLNDARGVQHHAFNLGHGILPHTPPENVGFVVERVHSQQP